MEASVFERIYAVVRRIPRGRVATYGQVALLAGNPRWARVVGYALHVNPEPGIIPCHRVVNRNGEVSAAFAFGGGNRNTSCCRRKGFPFSRTDASIWPPPSGTDAPRKPSINGGFRPYHEPSAASDLQIIKSRSKKSSSGFLPI